MRSPTRSQRFARASILSAARGVVLSQSSPPSPAPAPLSCPLFSPSCRTTSPITRTPRPTADGRSWRRARSGSRYSGSSRTSTPSATSSTCASPARSTAKWRCTSRWSHNSHHHALPLPPSSLHSCGSALIPRVRLLSAAAGADDGLHAAVHRRQPVPHAAAPAPSDAAKAGAEESLPPH